MSNEEHRVRIGELHQLVVASSDSGGWFGPVDDLAGWQTDVLTKILALTLDQEIHYLSSAKLDDDDWDFVAFTEKRVVRVLVATSEGSARLETTTFPRDSLESLELLDVGAIPGDDDPWPADLNLIGHYRSASIPLPLDKFASGDNKRELVRLLRSLLQDAEH